MMHEKSAGHSLNLHLNNRTRSLSTKKATKYVKNQHLTNFIIIAINNKRRLLKLDKNKTYDFFLQE